MFETIGIIVIILGCIACLKFYKNKKRDRNTLLPMSVLRGYCTNLSRIDTRLQYSSLIYQAAFILRTIYGVNINPHHFIEVGYEPELFVNSLVSWLQEELKLDNVSLKDMNFHKLYFEEQSRVLLSTAMYMWIQKHGLNNLYAAAMETSRFNRFNA